MRESSISAVRRVSNAVRRFDDDFKMIKRKGTIVSFGNASGKVEPFPIHKLAEKNVRLLRPV